MIEIDGLYFKELKIEYWLSTGWKFSYEKLCFKELEIRMYFE